MPVYRTSPTGFPVRDDSGQLVAGVTPVEDAPPIVVGGWAPEVVSALRELRASAAPLAPR
jgi:hypothetical protein